MLAAWDDVYPLTGTANNGITQWPSATTIEPTAARASTRRVAARDGKGIDYAIEQEAR